MASSYDMDLTNIHSTESHLSEIELLRLELKNQEEITMELETKLKDSKRNHETWKSGYDLKPVEIEQLTLELDYIKKEQDLNKMANKFQPVDFQKKTDELVANSEEIIKNLKAKLSDCIDSEKPEPECSQMDNSDYGDLIEEINASKIKYTATCERLDGLETKKIKLTETLSSLETEVLELRKSNTELKQAAAVANEACEEKIGEKAQMLAILNQSKPLSDLNGKDSLMDDAKNKYKLVLYNYKTLKDQYIKAKEMLAKNNDKIKRNSASSMKRERMNEERSNAAAELNSSLLQRIEDLNKSIEKLTKLENDLTAKGSHKLTNENRREVEIFSQILQNEERILEQEFKNMLHSKITFQLKFSECHRELESHTKQLFIKSEAYNHLQKQMEELQGIIQDKEAGKENRMDTSPEENMNKTVHFSKKIDYH